jgi:methylthioribose-1-phosphate isomerase
VLPKLRENSNALFDEALRIFDEDVELCRAMAQNGAPLIQDGDNILTHCNTGGLATAGLGTALAVIVEAFRSGKKIHVYVDETRPLLQGLRLTAWELSQHQIPFTVITDSMSGWLMKRKKIDRIFVGSDRIAVNGDCANKIGTYSLAILAKHHGVPFHIVAPRSTFDRKCLSGEDIHIELRKPEEIVSPQGREDFPAWNPSFDVTPAKLITSMIFNDGVFRPQDLSD